MCGICGFVHNKKIEKTILKRMNDTISYRGPNDEGIYLEDIDSNWQLGLAHKRLAVLDLSMAGHQPMLSEDGNIVICYNGEIYNYVEIKEELKKLGYVFKSNCDTEVIIYAYMNWGIECISRFNGMFAISIYDKSKEELFLIRDRMGVKPLYYYNDVSGIVFGSELKPIMEYPFFKKDINQNALGLFLAYKYIAGSETIFNHVYKLLPGSYLHWKKGHISIEKYWSIADKYSDSNIFNKKYDNVIDELQYLVRDSVIKRMISDVPIGCFLSGGYDSSLIAAVMQEQAQSKIKTFTIGFEEKEYNEAKYAEQVATAIGTEHYCTYLSVSQAKKYIEEMPQYYDEPMADESQIATMLLSKVTREKVTVALSGDAGDELFGGYNRYTELEVFSRLKPISMMLKGVDKFIPLKGNAVRKINKMMYFDSYENMINSDFLTYWDQYRNILSSTPSYAGYARAMKLSDVPEMKYMLSDMITYLPDDILTKVDRASMSVSLESRNPLLDYRIVEFALRLPMEYKIYKGNKKRILKDLTYRYIDKELLERPKQGFSVPVRKWLYEDLKGFTKGLLEEEYISRQGLFDYKYIKKMIQQFMEGKDNKAGDYIWTILVFQMWWERYMR